MRAAVLSLAIALWASPAVADPGSDVDAAATAPAIDTASCLAVDTTPGAPLEVTAPSGGLPMPPWDELVVEGKLVDSAATVRGLFEPTLQQWKTSLSPDKWKNVTELTAKFGYQLIGHRALGSKLVLYVEPLPIVRKVDVDMPQGLRDKLLDDEVRRRMRIRTGAYVPWAPVPRGCGFLEERERILEFLYDEGYAGAEVTVTGTVDSGAVRVLVTVDLGVEYKLGTITIPAQANGEALEVPEADIRAEFHHECWLGARCKGSSRFTRSQHQEDLEAVRGLFHKRGYPAVRVQSSFDPKTSFDRRTKTVNVTLAIDPRRKLYVAFQGDRDAVSDDDLHNQLTFDLAGSADDVEVVESARAITAFLQSRGFFDARVTWARERVEPQRAHDSAFDRITFTVDQGRQREVAAVDFVGNHAIATDRLRSITAIRAAGLYGSVFGTNTSATSAELAADVDRIAEAYRRDGYRDARVTARVSPSDFGLGDAALTAALIQADRGGDLHVRYTIEEGAPTLLTRIEIDSGEADKPIDGPTCAHVLTELATELDEPALARRVDPRACVATAPSTKFREDDVALTKDRLREFLFKDGRPRAAVEYKALEPEPHRAVAHYTLRNIGRLKIGKIIIRGNFRTRPSVIYSQLNFTEGDDLTTDALAESARRLRATNLFDAVNIDLPDLCAQLPASEAALTATCANTTPIANVVVRIEERYIDRVQIDLELGYSSYNHLFGTAIWRENNILGLGIGLLLQTTYGEKLTDIEATGKIPKWLSPHWIPFAFQTELTGLYRKQDTPRFGLLTTEGVTAATSWFDQRPRTATEPARTLSFGLRYDFRRRSRNLDALRPIGADGDDTQVAIQQDTGSIGLVFDWEQRVDRRGQASPLAPEDGFRFDASASFASPKLFGQDTFVKVSVDGSRFIPIGKNIVLRADLRYDQGFPLGGDKLLPDVERFFAGGDNTVRGYADDRLATEIIQVGVPPLNNVSQIRVIPAGGDIRVLGSLDGQIRIWKILAGAIFSDAGMITNQWATVTPSDIRPSIGGGIRALTPFGIAALEYAVPLDAKLGDDPRGRVHFYFAARAQF